MDELEIDGKIYLSSKAAAKLTGYAKDYVGQLCREGRVNARLVGRSWYVLEESIKSHRFGHEAEVESGSDKKDENLEQKEEVALESLQSVTQSQEKSSTYNADFEHVYFPDDSQPIEEAPILTQEHASLEEETQETEHISAMQDVWKEWFDHKGKQKEETGHSNQVTEQTEEQDDKNTSYLLDSSEDFESIEDSVPVHIIHKEKERVAVEVDYMAPVEPQKNSVQALETETEVVVRAPKPSISKPEGTFLEVKAGLVGLVVISVSITLIALGFFKPISTTNNPIYLYISGETKI